MPTDEAIFTPEERIRFECVIQANVLLHGMSAERVLEAAAKFEKFIKNGDNDNAHR